jgi:hypothetical protein
MECEIALNIAWNELTEISTSDSFKVTLLMDIYNVNLRKRSVTSEASAMPANSYISVIILHYLIGFLKYGYKPTGEWVSFKEIWGGNSFFPAYRKRTIQPLIDMLKRDPEHLINNIISMNGMVAEGGDFAVVLSTFPSVEVKIVLWKGEEEIPPEVMMLFDKSLDDILQTET